jgi:hypothetical protein
MVPHLPGTAPADTLRDDVDGPQHGPAVSKRYRMKREGLQDFGLKSYC